MGPNKSVTANFDVLSSGHIAYLTRTTVPFGGQSIGTTARERIGLVSSGTYWVFVGEGDIATNNFRFALTHDCVGAFYSGAGCNIDVAFTPTGVGLETATLSIIVALGPTSIVTKTVFLSGTGEDSLVTHYYRSILRRAPDAGGKAFWDGEAARMLALGVNANETWYSMASAFYTSAEYLALGRDNTGFVTDLYSTFFNRAPDAGRLAFWTGQLAAGDAAGSGTRGLHVLHRVRELHAGDLRKHGCPQGDRHGGGLLPGAARAPAGLGRLRFLGSAVPRRPVPGRERGGCAGRGDLERVCVESGVLGPREEHFTVRGRSIQRVPAARR